MLLSMAAFASMENDEFAAQRRRGLPATVRLSAPNGSEICARCGVADSMISSMRGLLGRAGLGEGEGLLITSAPSVMTFFMRFSIDVIFLDERLRIVGIRHELPPWRLAAARGAVGALELPAGTAATRGLEVGQTISLADADDE
jgi:uncharacterized membrane protein (UPF0127 family)